MEKVFVFLGKKESDTYESFRARYLGKHKEKILAAGVSKYLANTCEKPSQALLDAGWGVYSDEGNVFEAFDEVWTDDVEKLLASYEDENLICAYRTEEHTVKTCNAKCDADHEGGESFWIKRITLVKRKDGAELADFFKYWKEIHGPLGLDHLIGTGIYRQNYVWEVITGRDFEWDGVTELLYWNEDAFRYGHFSRPDSTTILGADCAQFIGSAMTLLFKEYIQKA